VLLAAFTHATWNLAAKRAAGSRHFVWLYSVGSVLVYTPVASKACPCTHSKCGRSRRRIHNTAGV
jgi:hypothetical protein